jgi:GT2 family glycosyltransferase/glycosyltransferase involved in cell wall biosynthesis
MGLVAILWGNEVYLVGRAAYEVITALEDEQQRYLALEFFLSNYLVPFELVFNMEYINFRLSDPNEEEIALRHRVEIDKVIAEEAMRDLEQRAVQCDEKIVSLNQIIAECDSRIVGLSQTVRERDGQIVSLSQMMSERDSQIASLSQEVSGRRDQIDSMNQAMSWRDGRIADLCQIVSERDAQVAILNETVSNLNDRLDSLDYALQVQRRALDAETERVLTLLSSKSWRITKPLRLGLDVLSSFGIYLGGAAKKFYHALPLTKQAKANHHYFLAKEFPLLLKLINSGPPLRMVHEEFVSDQKNIIESSPVVTQNLVDDCIDSLEISYPLFSSPAVSIIIPVYGKINYTLRCLSSIKRNLPKARFEVIVVNDCSQDNTVQELRKIHGLVLVNNTENLGFIRSCNAGAKVARGEYLCFLNNDTEVKNGWLDELLRTFSEFPGAGLVGSKLIYPDGRLQEAGGIIWKDGSAWNFGRFQDPNLPVYNYAREVDYCSGASIMMPKVVFDELKGFDEHYIPAYCEDSDIALKVRDKGYRVIYQPLSMVIHYEGVTSGTDTTQGIKQYQIENSKKLFERWQGRLISHQASGMDVDNAKDRKATRRVLVLDHCTPTPNQDAGSVTVFNLLLLLREMNFQVTFIPEDNFLYMPEYTSSLQRVGVEVLYAPYVTSVVQHVEEYGARYDLAFLFRPEVIERHLKSVRKHCPNAKVLYHTVDLHYLRMTREAQLQSNKAKQEAADAMQQREFAAMRAADASIVHSTVELELLRPLLPSVNLYVFPLIMEIKGSTRPFTKRKDIVFVGGYQHTPNVDAVKYFVGEIMPLLRKKLPGVCFYAVGSNPPAEIKDLASQDVEITGFVADLPSLLARMRVSVAPLRFGAGIKGKIGTAMAVGLPVVATSIAAEGMSLINEENILVADEPESIADAISRVYQNEALWNHISGNGINFADQEWGANAAWGILSKIIVDLGFEIDSNKRRLVLYSDSREIVDEVK